MSGDVSEPVGDGPAIESLVRRLAETPAEFLAAPRLGAQVGIEVAAVVSDLFVAHGASGLDSSGAATFRPVDERSRNWLRVVLVTAWLLHDEWFVARPRVEATWRLLTTRLADLAANVAADDLVTDQDRREELARLVLDALEVVPAGETPAQAADRLATLDSAERRRVIEATRAAELRAAEVRAAMHAKAAAEAAAKASRE